MNTRWIDYTVLTIAIIGAINWGLIGFFNLNLITLLFGNMPVFSRVIYALVGIAGIYLLSVFGRISSIDRDID